MGNIKINIKEIAEGLLNGYHFIIGREAISEFERTHKVYIDFQVSEKIPSTMIIQPGAHKQLYEDVHTMITYLMAERLKHILDNEENDTCLGGIFVEQEYELIEDI